MSPFDYLKASELATLARKAEHIAPSAYIFDDHVPVEDRVVATPIGASKVLLKRAFTIWTSLSPEQRVEVHAATRAGLGSEAWARTPIAAREAYIEDYLATIVQPRMPRSAHATL